MYHSVWDELAADDYKRKRWSYPSAREFAQEHVGENYDGAMRLMSWAQRRTHGHEASVVK